MPLPKPNLDTSNFDQFIEESKKIIPRYAPEWTDHNFSDPRIEEYKKINAIIRRDDAVSTLKYALLRGTIEICQESPFKRIANGRAYYPLGLLVEKWIYYYYPLFAHKPFIPQLVGEKDYPHTSKKIAFRKDLTDIAEYYQTKGGFSVFCSDFKKGNIPDVLEIKLLRACKDIRTRIVDMPMKYLGRSQTSDYYSIFMPHPKNLRIRNDLRINKDQLVQNFGLFSVSNDLSQIFEILGGFVLGEDTLLTKWADFSFKVAKNLKMDIHKESILAALAVEPETERSIAEIKKFYTSLLDSNGYLECVWSGKKMHSMTKIHVDHLLPFSVWKNNDLWNLMPSDAAINVVSKSDKIPSEDLLTSRKEAITRYWDMVHEHYGKYFETEMRLSLLGRNDFPPDWKELAFEAMKQRCRYLIDMRGYSEWNF